MTPSIYAAVDFAGASNSWRASPLLRERMQSADRNARVPTMFVQAKNDFDLAPSKVSSETTQALGKVGELAFTRRAVIRRSRVMHSVFAVRNPGAKTFSRS
jgi:hypothetical protein